MASNDSGVDTSNDSTDNFLIPSPPVIQNQEKIIQHVPVRGGKFKQNRRELRMAGRNAPPYHLPRENIWPRRARERNLLIAASTCNVERLTNLLEAGTNPNCSDQHQRSALHLAACRGYVDIVRPLLQYGANPNILDSLGNTPLHLAVFSLPPDNGSLVIVSLLRAGADVSRLNRGEKTPLELAESKLELMKSRYKPITPENAKLLHEMTTVVMILRNSSRAMAVGNNLDTLENLLQKLSTRDNDCEENEDDAMT